MDTFSIFIFWTLPYLILLMTFFLKSLPFHFQSSISSPSLGIIVNKLHQLFSIHSLSVVLFSLATFFSYSVLFSLGNLTNHLGSGPSPSKFPPYHQATLTFTGNQHQMPQAKGSVPHSHFQHQLQMHVITSASYQPIANQELQ